MIIWALALLDLGPSKPYHRVKGDGDVILAKRSVSGSTRADDNRRLQDLEDRLTKLRSTEAPKSADADFRQGEMAWRMVIELVSGLGIGLAVGYALDWFLGTMPIFLILFVLLGLAAGVKVMLGTARELGAPVPAQDEAAETPEEEDDERGD